MEFKRLKYFVAVAEELHFGRAAERLEMAQPPLSRQIAQLEQDLDVLLFDRSRSQIRLTQAGETLFERTREILELLDSAYRETTMIGKGGAGILRIGFVGSATHGPLPRLIKAFRSNYPPVDLALYAMNNAESERALVQREIDIAIARPRLAGDEFRTDILNSEPFILALPEDSKWSKFDKVPLADLHDEVFVLFPRRPRPAYCDRIMEVCRQEGFVPRQPVMSQDFQTAISLVSVGVGISVVPESVSQSKIPGIAFRPYIGANPGTSLSAHARLDNQSRHVSNFFDLLKIFRKQSGWVS
jgi:LysR family transcriptional regulator, benzoate and cis,cis-muconate-responsive activator of ben and cat genes